MVPNWLPLVLFGTSAVAFAVVGWLTLRRWLSDRRNAAETTNAEIGSAVHARRTTPHEWQSQTAAPCRPANRENGARKPMMAPVAATSNRNSWSDRGLFDGFESQPARAASDIPFVDYDQNPSVGGEDYVFGAVTPAVAALLPESEKRRNDLKKELRTAGFYQPHAWENLTALRYVAIMGSVLFFGALLVLAPPKMEFVLAGLLVICGALGWALPRLFVKNKAVERTSQIERGMPDLLDMLNMCVSQGLTVRDSLNRISRDLRPVYPDLGRELAIVVDQAEVGSIEHALTNFSERIDVPEVRSFTSLLCQTQRMGTSVSQALTEYSDNIRENLRQRSDEKANRATFKLLFPTVLCLMPAVYMFLLGPAVIELSKFFNEDGGRAVVESGQDAIQRLNVQQQ